MKDRLKISQPLLKYWKKLSHIEKKYKLDDIALYSLDIRAVFEPTANSVASENVIDLCCGAGGASISFALKGKSVIANDINDCRLQMTKHNAIITNTISKIKLYNLDAIELLNILDLNGSAIYIDMPWDGPSYIEKTKFSIKDFPLDANKIIKTALNKSREVILKAPINFNLLEIESISKPSEIIENRYKGKAQYISLIFRDV